jgi:hypothetical protein
LQRQISCEAHIKAASVESVSLKFDVPIYEHLVEEDAAGAQAPPFRFLKGVS